MIAIELENNKQQALIKSNLLPLIREQFSVINPTYGKNKFANQFAPKRLYAITPTGKFDIGLYKNIIDFLQQEGYNLSEIKSNIADYFNPSFKNYNISELNLSLRDYQRESISAALNHGRGVVVLPTGAGKTLAIATLINSIFINNKNFKFLVIVPTLQLITQTYSDLLEYGIDTSIITKWSGEDTPNFECNIIIAGLQILQSQHNNHLDLLKNINVLIVDECHKLRKKNEFNNIIKLITTPNKFGFTGTMPPELLDQWNIIGKLGPILYEKQSILLRENKQITNINIQILVFDYVNKPSLSSPNSFHPTKAFEEEAEFLTNSEGRNNKIASLCKNTDKNTLIVVERIVHGELLFNKIKLHTPNKQVFFIQGSVDVSIREEIRALMEKEHNIICIAISKVFAEGINIKNLHYIIFAASGKAKVKILQTIGRGVRLHPLKNMLYIFDIADNLRYGNKHLKERIKLYEAEKIYYKKTEIQV